MFKSKSTFGQKLQGILGSGQSTDLDNVSRKLKILKNSLLIVCMSVYLAGRFKKKKSS